MKLPAIVTKPLSIERILHSLGESTVSPPLAPARGPPYARNRVFRNKSLQHQPSDLFDNP